VIAQRWMVKDNTLTLKGSQNQVFFIKDRSNIVIKTKNPNDYKNLMISFVNVNNIGKKEETYQKGDNYQLYKCSDSNCRFEKKDDFVIYKFKNNTKELEKINEILIWAVNLQKAAVSFLKEKADNSVDYNWTADYILKTWDNNLKFPTVKLQPNETLFIKIKIINDNLSL